MSPDAINIVTQVFFYAFAAMTVIFAAMVVFSRNPVRSILFLVLTFFAVAGLWIIARAEFLGLVLVVVYVGAVMTLFLFVVMMLNVDELMKHKGLVRFYPLVFLLAGLILAALIIFVGPWHFGLQQFAAPAALPAHFSNTKALGMTLYTDFMLPFELAGVLYWLRWLLLLRCQSAVSRAGLCKIQRSRFVFVRKIVFVL